MTSLLGGARESARWKAFFVPAPGTSLETADIALSPDGSARRGSRGLMGADGRLFTLASQGPVSNSPDETRVKRADKGRRVVSQTPASDLPPRGFAAGSIMERQSLLGSRVIGGGERIRTAFAKITPETRDAITVAANFQLKGPPKIPALAPERRSNDELLLASLKPTTGPQALGYAPEATSATARSATLFEKVLKEQPQAFVPPIGAKDHAWAATPLPASVFSEKEQTCLTNGIYFESRGEKTLGQAAVAQVILNRVRNPAYPKSICGVVYQNKDWRNRCQFSFACDGLRDRVSDPKAWNAAKTVADQVTRGQIWLAEVGSSTHYHATYVQPRWAQAMEKVDRIGKHIFYRTFGGGW
ncbi:cell wall hydrolase [Aurantimonas sp. Leaf443]|uniref:cell wall hydrolase n=1 Tax=Aurantimonas sp. Leaf443 TaxID=1736378 RepID=UPI0006F69C34|nr:cell wall hydrolase [Aurantimonas sp. Leaf443]KQT82155.1 hypothetical protein ASG48_16045 [Aurantimonas sp. Leaf443]